MKVIGDTVAQRRDGDPVSGVAELEAAHDELECGRGAPDRVRRSASSSTLLAPRMQITGRVVELATLPAAGLRDAALRHASASARADRQIERYPLSTRPTHQGG